MFLGVVEGVFKQRDAPSPPARLPPPVAHASGSHTLTLPNSSLVLRGSVTDGDQSQVTFLWARDSQSPAAGVSPHTTPLQEGRGGRGG